MWLNNLKNIDYNTSAEMPKPTKKLEASVVTVGKKNRFAALEDSSERQSILCL